MEKKKEKNKHIYLKFCLSSINANKHKSYKVYTFSSVSTDLNNRRDADDRHRH